MTLTKKFSEFSVALQNNSDEEVVGLETGINVRSERFLNWTTAGRPVSPFNGLLGLNTDLQNYEFWDEVAMMWTQMADTNVLAVLASHLPGQGASLIGLEDQSNVTSKTVQDLANASFIVQMNNGSLQNAQALGSLTTGIVKNTTATGVLSISAPLTSIDGLTTAANEMLYTTAADTYATTSITALGRSLVAGATAEAVRVILGLAPLTDGQLIIGATGTNPSLATLTQGSGVTITNSPGGITISATGTGGTVTSLSAGTGVTLTPDPITTTGSIALTVPVTAILGGTGLTTYTLGDTLYSSAANTLAKLAGNITTTKQYLSQTGDGALSAAPAWATISGSDITGAALTKTDDTNVTLTLGGTPTTALLRAASLTLGWTGTLSGTRGGTGVNNGSNTATFAGNLNFAADFTTSGAFAVTQTYTGATNVTFPTTGTLATTSQIPTGAALTRTDDTNVTLTLGGSPSTALINAASLTLGWTGLLSGTRGGTGVNNGSNTATFAGNLNFAAAFTTSGSFAVTQTYTGVTNVTFPTTGTLATTSQIPTGAALTKTDDTNVTLTLGGSPTTALINAASLTLGWTGQLGLTRGGSNASLTASNGGIVYSTATAMAILAGTATAGQMLRSGSSGAPSWSTATYPATASTSGNVLTSDGTNFISSAPAAAATSVIVDDTTTNATMYPIWVTASTGSLPLKVSSTKLSFNPSTATLTLVGSLSSPTSITSSTGLAVLEFSYAASAVNHIYVQNSATGVASAISVTGTDSTIGIAIATKNSFVALQDNTLTSSTVLRFYNAAATKYTGLKVATAQATDLTLTLPAVDGTNADLWSNGSGVLSLGTYANANITSLTGLTGTIRAPSAILDTNGVNILQFTTTASAVNYFVMANNSTGNAPYILATGSDATVAFGIVPKGGVAYIQDSAGVAAGTLSLQNAANNHFTRLTIAAAQAVNLTLTLPSVDGSAGQFLKTDASGVLAFSSTLPASAVLGTPASGTLTNCTGYTVANLSDIAYTSYTPTYTGFVDNNLGTTGYYKRIGRTCHVYMVDPVNGTSNANTFTISLPVTAGAQDQYVSVAQARNNSAFTANASGKITASGTTLTLNLSGSSTGWTTSGNKSAFLNFSYETST